MANVDFNIMFLDELFANLDTDVRNIMLGVLTESLANERCVFVINHAEMADDFFNHKIRVRLVNKNVTLSKKKLKKAKTKDNDSNVEFSDLIGSLTLNNCGLNMETIWNITYYAFHDQLKRMGWRDQFNINNQMALAGAKVDKEKLKHWIKSISSEN